MPTHPLKNIKLALCFTLFHLTADLKVETHVFLFPNNENDFFSKCFDVKTVVEKGLALIMAFVFFWKQMF